MTQEELLEKLMSLDFMSLDLGLYLDTHPDNAEAIAQYNQMIEAASLVREKYESEYGPLCSFRSLARDDARFTWVNSPWPWQAAGNPTMTGGCE